MTTPKPPEFDAWRPWAIVFDAARERYVRVTKEAHELPIVIELARDAAFRERARLWAWSKQGPTTRRQTSTNWPPKFATPIEWIGLYYYEIYRGFYRNAPNLLEPSPQTMEQAMNQAKTLCAANPLLAF
ncbi:MAG: hypothetical protein ACT4OU_00305 [Hyphomicrobium sp.]